MSGAEALARMNPTYPLFLNHPKLEPLLGWRLWLAKEGLTIVIVESDDVELLGFLIAF